MNFPKVKIGDLIPKYPIIQGGMAIRVSTAKLAAAVANEGGIGVIAATGMAMEELKDEIKKAKDMTSGILGVNIMYAATDFVNLIKTSVQSGIDVVISGAGFSRDMFAIGKEYNVPIIPVVSTLKLAKISDKLGAAAIVVEGGNAGGHLGTDKDSWELISEIKKAVKIPVFGAGGVVNPEDIKKMLDLGADGVQMGTRFAASKESETKENFEKLYIEAKEGDVINIMSSAGFPANALKSPMVEKIIKNEAPKPTKCIDCLKTCSKKFCIKDGMLYAHEDDYEKGVFFSGTDAYKIKEILSVKEIFDEIKNY